MYLFEVQTEHSLRTCLKLKINYRKQDILSNIGSLVLINIYDKFNIGSFVVSNIYSRFNT